MNTKTKNRLRKKFRIRKNMFGTTVKPRLSVFKSLKHVYAQIIDDSTGKTLVSASTLSKDIENEVKEAKNKIELSKIVGNLVAKKAIDNKINEVVFDRNGFRYHGRIKALADSAREAGLKI
ncbi:MAG: 50S ribosomal protein L18 [Melioribacteraceae bacterium]|nr:50S ribosomal protein L18 [Melioribacteraceae bacterium]